MAISTGLCLCLGLRAGLAQNGREVGRMTGKVTSGGIRSGGQGAKPVYRLACVLEVIAIAEDLEKLVVKDC